MIRYAFAFLALLALAGCQSSEERAEGHYQSALALLEEGDLDRATVEFRNVFDLNGLHVDARRTFANALREGGDFDQSFGQYLRLAEQLPNDVEARLSLAEMAIEVQNWGQVRLHGTRLLELVPEELRTGEQGTRIEIVATTLEYALAIENEDAPARRVAAADAERLLEASPDTLGLYRVLVDNAIRDADLATATTLIDRALVLAPDNRDLHNTRLSLLAGNEDIAGVRGQLEDMIARFPDDTELVSSLLRFHMSQGDTEAAEAFLRAQIDLAEAASDDNALQVGDLRSALVQFILRIEGSDAALAELEAQIAATDDNLTLRMLQASILFAIGETDRAIADVEALVAAEGATPAQVSDAKVVLAGMYMETGNQVGARRLVGEVLEVDNSHVAALRIEASWLIGEDRADDAIGLLRNALDAEPNDTASMSLMAQAHARNGNRELSRDFLALAFETSNSAPEETLLYARDLMQDDAFLAAEEALITALRLQPGSLDLLEVLGELYISMEDWDRSEQVEDTVRRQGTDASEALANGIRLARLNAQGETDEVLEFLDGLADGDDARTGLAAQLATVSTFMSQGQIAEARTYLEEALAEDPGNLPLLLARGVAEREGGDLETAIGTFEAVIQVAPTVERAWIELIRTEAILGDTEAASETLERALTELPDGVNLLWAQASFFEQAGDIDGAIAVYESLYAELPNSPIVANNLASLISTHRTGEEDLERAYAIARRLRGTEIPPLMDTYGWINFRRGDIEEARSYLAGAAAALTEDALVQFHYGMLLAAAEEVDEAIAQLTVALDLAGDDPRPQFETAREELLRLEELRATLEAEAEGDE